jgi:hypothetical protein
MKDILLQKEIQLSTLESIPLDTYHTIANGPSKLRDQLYAGLAVMMRDRMIELIS